MRITVIFLLPIFFMFGCSTLGLSSEVNEVFLWEIQKDNHKGYLMGTMHEGVPLDDMPSGLFPIFDRAGVLVTEIDGAYIKSELQSNKDQMMPEHYFQRSEIQMSSRLEPKVYAEAIRRIYALEELKKIPEDTLNSLNPIGFAYFLNSTLPAEKIEVSRGEWQRRQPKFGLDYNLYLRAIDFGKSVAHLELPYDDLRKKCDNAISLEFIQDFVANKIQDGWYANLKKLELAYRSGSELETMKYFENKTHSFATDSFKCLIVERNLKWLPKIRNHVESNQTPFIAVGLFHMLNIPELENKSLLSLLTKDGYQVRRIFLKSKN